MWITLSWWSCSFWANTKCCCLSCFERLTDGRRRHSNINTVIEATWWCSVNSYLWCNCFTFLTTLSLRLLHTESYLDKMATSVLIWRFLRGVYHYHFRPWWLIIVLCRILCGDTNQESCIDSIKLMLFYVAIEHLVHLLNVMQFFVLLGFLLA